eukprot:CAMPEP_0174240108 /NCGR_PEP_ID=MMETSP0417-20130205/17438_1 /TAXON_ID=242541 /ORGANISM="Mayorella sp, Strain BSH-02190019" /LENGTH=899 /DNA_ID=CAMNT_0015319141 /DNA_START=95 /DNA_END=2790 /DNA_ORIENTATION=-
MSFDNLLSEIAGLKKQLQDLDKELCAAEAQLDMAQGEELRALRHRLETLDTSFAQVEERLHTRENELKDKKKHSSASASSVAASAPSSSSSQDEKKSSHHRHGSAIKESSSTPRGQESGGTKLTSSDSSPCLTGAEAEAWTRALRRVVRALATENRASKQQQRARQLDAACVTLADVCARIGAELEELSPDSRTRRRPEEWAAMHAALCLCYRLLRACARCTWLELVCGAASGRWVSDDGLEDALEPLCSAEGRSGGSGSASASSSSGNVSSTARRRHHPHLPRSTSSSGSSFSVADPFRRAQSFLQEACSALGLSSRGAALKLLGKKPLAQSGFDEFVAARLRAFEADPATEVSRLLGEQLRADLPNLVNKRTLTVHPAHLDPKLQAAVTRVQAFLEGGDGTLLLKVTDSASSSSSSSSTSTKKSTSNNDLPSAASSSSSSTAGSSSSTDVPPHIQVRWKDLEVVKRIGTGAFAEVHEAYLAGERVAVKRINTEKDAREQLVNEVCVMSRLHSGYIVPLYGADFPSHSSDTIMVMEHMERGSLYDLINNEDLDLPWDRRWALARDAALGLYYLHTRSPPIVHRDLKSGNLLVGADWRAKLCDFGLALPTIPEPPAINCGTPRWTAPEVNNAQPYTVKADVYSYAIILWELAARQIPWSHDLTQDMINLVSRGHRPQIPKDTPEDFADLMKKCWAPKPEDRPDFAAIVDIFRKRGLLDQRTVVSQGTLDRLREEKDKLEEEARVLAQRRSELEQRCKQAEKEIEKAEDDARAFQRQIDEEETNLEKLALALRTAEQAQARVERELESAKKTNEQQLEKLAKKKKRLVKAHTRDLQEQEEVLAEHREKYEKEQKKVARLEEKLRKLEERNKELETESMLAAGATGKTLSRVVSTYTPSSR